MVSRIVHPKSSNVGCGALLALPRRGATTPSSRPFSGIPWVVAVGWREGVADTNPALAVVRGGSADVADRCPSSQHRAHAFPRLRASA